MLLYVARVCYSSFCTVPHCIKNQFIHWIFVSILGGYDEQYFYVLFLVLIFYYQCIFISWHYVLWWKGAFSMKKPLCSLKLNCLNLVGKCGERMTLWLSPRNVLFFRRNWSSLTRYIKWRSRVKVNRILRTSQSFVTEIIILTI